MEKRQIRMRLGWMISGAAFLLLITPAWKQGFLAVGVFALLLCACIAWLPIPTEKMKVLSMEPMALSVAVFLMIPLGFNYFHIWKNSRIVAKISTLLHISGKSCLIPGSAAVLILLSAPAVSGVLNYYYNAVKELQTQNFSRGGGYPFLAE